MADAAGSAVSSAAAGCAVGSAAAGSPAPCGERVNSGILKLN